MSIQVGPSLRSVPGWAIFLVCLVCSNGFLLGEVSQKIDSVLPPSGVPINAWQVVGPWRYKTIIQGQALQADSGLDHDYLKSLSHPESEIGFDAFTALLTGTKTSVSNNELRNAPVRADAYTHILHFASGRRPVDYAVAYAGTVLESPSDQDIAIAVGVDDTAKIWLNNELLGADPASTTRLLSKFALIVGAHLRKGRNFLLVKTENKTNQWQLVVTLYPRDRALSLARDNAVSTLVSKRVVSPGEDILLRGDLFSSTQGQVRVLDQDDHAVIETTLKVKRNFSISPSALAANHLYRCQLKLREGTYEETFFYGDPEAALDLYKKRDEGLPADDTTHIDLAAQQERLRHLLQPENRSTNFWDQKIVWSIQELNEMYARLDKQENPHKEIAGAHLRGFSSAVDCGIQHYWLHVPERAIKSGRPIPLIIVMPYTTATNEPFLKSYFLAAFDEDERYRLLGDEFGVAVLQVWGRGNNIRDTSIGMADVFESLRAVQADYQIDRDRISLLGYREGGRLALLLGERYPDKFAGIAVESPITTKRSQLTYRKLWDLSVSPLDMADALVNTPVYIEHDEHDTASIQASSQFASRCKNAGGSVVLETETGGFAGFYQDPTEIKRHLFSFLNGKERKVDASTVIIETGSLKYGHAYWIGIDDCEDWSQMANINANRAGNQINVRSTNVIAFSLLSDKLGIKPGEALTVNWNGAIVYQRPFTGDAVRITSAKQNTQETSRKTENVAGPVLDAFGNQFVIVAGKRGSQAESEGVEKLTREICASWKLAYFVDCPVKEDSQVTPQDIATKNLILVGTATTNSVTARISEQLPLSITSNQISLAGKVYAGPHLGFEMVCPNPLNPAKYVVLVGSTQMDGVRLWNLHMSKDGVCDYFILQLDGVKPDLLDAGYFDSTWSHLQSVLIPQTEQPTEH